MAAQLHGLFFQMVVHTLKKLTACSSVKDSSGVPKLPMGTPAMFVTVRAVEKNWRGYIRS